MHQLGFISILLSTFTIRAIPVSTSPPKIVLITLDGVRWQEVFNGADSALDPSLAFTARDLLPNIYDSFVDKGIVIGKESEMQVSGPNFLSLPGYLEIMRGHPAHDCQINECYPKKDISILDYYHQWYPSAEIAAIASWETISRVANTSPSYVINIGRVRQNWHDMDTQYPPTFSEDEREDLYTEAATNLYLHNHHPDLLWISLCDTDSYAHMGDYKKYIQSLQNSDRFIGQLIRDLPADTTFILTTDHGRGIDWRNHGSAIESRRTWLMMRGPQIPHKGFVKLNHPITASWIFPTAQNIVDGADWGNSILPLLTTER